MATGNAACTYNLPVGILEPGRAADVALIDAPAGSIAMAMIDGEIVVKRSKNTIPPQRTYRLKLNS